MRHWVVFFAAVLTCGALDTRAQEIDQAMIERGKAGFIKSGCDKCHGDTGQGGGPAGPRLNPNAVSWERFERQVRSPRADMPVFADDQLSKQELSDIYAFLRSVRPPARKG